MAGGAARACYRAGMSRRLEVILCFVLFTAIMFALKSALQGTVPDIVASLNRLLGDTGSAVLIFGAPAAAGIWSFREHRRQASARRL
ncbi:hypothetical protein ASF59_09975 [Methylobacterium sp. Leaf121]|nr:hypothetical protein ASF59_09975 [Methylobacterium sp. Leaf121]